MSRIKQLALIVLSLVILYGMIEIAVERGLNKVLNERLNSITEAE